MATQLITRFKLRIIDVVGDGFIGVDEESDKLFKKKVVVKDKLALKNNNYEKDDVVEIEIKIIEGDDIEDDIRGKRFCCVVNELTNNGFYTKHYREYENRFKRVFFYEARGMITFFSEDYERFEVGDILKVNVRRL